MSLRASAPAFAFPTPLNLSLGAFDSLSSLSIDLVSVDVHGSPLLLRSLSRSTHSSGLRDLSLSFSRLGLRLLLRLRLLAVLEGLPPLLPPLPFSFGGGRTNA